MLAAGLLPALSLVSGCGKKGDQAAPAPKATPSPKSSPPAVSVTTGGVNLFLFDAKGRRVARLTAATVGYNPRDDQNIVTVTGGKATLYEKGQPAATLTADTVTANRTARTITGVGNVVAHSLTQKGAPTIRSDRMVWQHDARVIMGDGNVTVSADPDYRLYGRSFKADTKLRRVSVKVGETPATGSL
jgi:LPS export ABC transporter protein LptC